MSRLDYAELISGYFDRKNKALVGVKIEEIISLYEALKTVSTNRKRAFIAGNGGSAATAEHFVTDIGIGAYLKGGKNPVKALSLNSSPAVITALANDACYEDVFSKQLELHQPSNGDLVVVFSASGNSPNVLNLLQSAKLIGVQTCAITGFDGGAARKSANFSVHVETEPYEYGIVEDLHLSICHVVTELLRK